jgi:anti-sigma factor RsiW
MSEHDKIRELLALAAAGALTTSEERQVAEHVRSCKACLNELEAWRPIATDLCRLPTPQPSSWLVQATLARAEAKLAEQVERDCNRGVMIFVVAFAWLLTIASWPVFRFVSGRFGSLLEPQFGHTRISFAAFTALGWLAGGVAAVMLAIRQRGERRLA